MRAATLNAPEDLRLVEKDKPTPGKNEVLLKIEANTMCGTDYRLYTGAKTSGVSYGTVPGHEIAGRIVEIGEASNRFSQGSRLGNRRQFRSWFRAVLAPTVCKTANTSVQI